MLLDGAMARLGAGLVRWGGKALAAAVSHEPAHLASRGRTSEKGRVVAEVSSKSREHVTFFSKLVTETGASFHCVCRLFRFAKLSQTLRLNTPKHLFRQDPILPLVAA